MRGRSGCPGASRPIVLLAGVTSAMRLLEVAALTSFAVGGRLERPYALALSGSASSALRLPSVVAEGRSPAEASAESSCQSRKRSIRRWGTRRHRAAGCAAALDERGRQRSSSNLKIRSVVEQPEIRLPWISSQLLVAQVIELVFGRFDAFGDHVQAQRMAHGDDGGGNGFVVRIGGSGRR